MLCRIPVPLNLISHIPQRLSIIAPTSQAAFLLKPHSRGHFTQLDWKMEGKGTMMTGVAHAPTYLGWSICNTLCCCLPLGIIAIVFSCRTDTANLIGDTTRAQAHSSLAKKLNIASLVIGILFVILYTILYVTVLNQ
ncbi:hypothetical protein QTP70_020226 [Hemibagrus guttatus]|uniref:Uncharacterized protein n=1 Tax=Hemibagrus guttatus TaxID=175788 RepID=A0AAE0UK43_9TELE|nr:hypothetical protein QTP70_020226 [Hemibagrus guttatus]